MGDTNLTCSLTFEARDGIAQIRKLPTGLSALAIYYIFGVISQCRGHRNQWPNQLLNSRLDFAEYVAAGTNLVVIVETLSASDGLY